MRSRLGVLAAVLLLSATPAFSQWYSVSAVADRWLSAVLDGGDVAAEVMAWQVTSLEGAGPPVYPGGPESAVEGCVSVGTGGFPNDFDGLLDFGCGSLSFSIDPLLEHAEVSGTIVSEIFDLATGDSLGSSTIQVYLEAIASGLPTPMSGAGPDLDVGQAPEPFVSLEMYALAGVTRQAGGSGVIESSGLGERLSGDVAFATMFAGASLFVNVAA